MRVTCIALLVAAVATAASSYDAYDYEVPETNFAEEMVKALSGAEELAEVQLSADMAKGAKVLANLRQLKAYALGVHSQAKHALGFHSSMKHSAIVQLLVAYGDPLKKKNIVSEYGAVMGALRKKYNKGINRYLLRRLDKATLRASGALATESILGKLGSFVVPDHLKLGLKSRPGYFKRLGVRITVFSTLKNKVDKMTSDADHVAAAAWILKGSKKYYKSFLSRVKAKWKRAQKRHEEDLAKTGITAIHASFVKAEKGSKKKQDLVIPMPPSGMAAINRAAARSQYPGTPSTKALKKEAKAAAAEWSKKKKSTVTTTRMIRAMEHNRTATTTTQFKKGKARGKARGKAKKKKNAKKVKQGLKNAGKNCWTPCRKKNGKCAWCGTGACCRQGWKKGGCDGKQGAKNHHACVAQKKAKKKKAKKAKGVVKCNCIKCGLPKTHGNMWKSGTCAPASSKCGPGHRGKGCYSSAAGACNCRTGYEATKKSD